MHSIEHRTADCAQSRLDLHLSRALTLHSMRSGGLRLSQTDCMVTLQQLAVTTICLCIPSICIKCKKSNDRPKSRLLAAHSSFLGNRHRSQPTVASCRASWGLSSGHGSQYQRVQCPIKSLQGIAPHLIEKRSLETAGFTLGLVPEVLQSTTRNPFSQGRT